jgi:hypothetical protein
MEQIIVGEYPIADELHATEVSLPFSFGHKEEIFCICESVRRSKVR